MEKMEKIVNAGHHFKTEVWNLTQHNKSLLSTLIPEFEKLKGRMNKAEAKVDNLEKENQELREKLAVALIALENHGNKIASTQMVDESKSATQSNLEFHHELLESQESLMNQNLCHTLFIRTTNVVKLKHPKKHLLETIEKVLGTKNLELAKESIETVHVINGRSSCLRMKMKPKCSEAFVNLLKENQESLEKNGMFAQRNQVRTTRTKNAVLGKIVQKLKSQFGKKFAYLPRFDFQSCLYIYQSTTDSFQKLSYHEAISEFGYLLKSEVRFQSKMYWLLGKSVSYMQKKAILLL